MFSAIRIIRGCAAVLIAVLVLPPSIGHAQANLVFGDGFEVQRPDGDAEAARFLNQATFGATMQDIARVRQLGYEGWLQEQFALPVGWNHVQKTLQTATYAGCNYLRPTDEDLNTSLWGAYRGAPDQLRQRMTEALSQILVVSQNLQHFYENGLLVPSYRDMLTSHAFGNFRDLLEAVARHPAMGQYLSHAYNPKEDPATGRIPDQNFARELMQLFSIGLEELNLDGTPRLFSSGPNAGQPIPTYGQDDIEGLSRVFTGWIWASQNSFNRPGTFSNTCNQVDQTQPMRAFPSQHSTSEKRFLGLTIPAQTSPDPEASLDAALDRVFNHPNVGPFIGRQLIQRLVVSNPSPAYVTRVARAFNNNGQGVRGDLQAVLRAVLLDPEARDRARINDPTWGKIREPVLRHAQLMRAVGATTIEPSGGYRVRLTGQFWEFGIGSPPMRSPTVFNHYRPSYVPPGSDLAALGLVAPEMQIVNEFRITEWTGRWLREAVFEGGFTDCCSDQARDFYYWRLDYAPLIALLQQNPQLVVDRLDLLFTGGTLSPQMRQLLAEELATNTGAVSPLSGRPRGVDHLRVGRTLGLLVASTEYVVQK
jgi:uncharacterized protein (DUF1800 family)